MLTVSDIISKLESIAPQWLAEESDRIGLQVGDPNAVARVVRVCVDASPSVVHLALDQGADLVIAHHPLIYTPLLFVTAGDPVAETVAALIRKGASLYVMHTNYDSAPDGVNDCLAAALGLTDTVLMTPRKRDQLHKIAVFVPREAVGSVRDAMARAGAGVIGNYTCCSFRTAGTGSFLPSHQAQPHTGTPGTMEEVEEYRLEMLCSGACLGVVIDAMRAAHPYEEVAYDVYSLANESPAYGFGRVGDLDAPMSLSEYVQVIREALRPSCLKVVGQPDRIIKRVAVGSGGCSSLYADAVRLGADLYVTGDTKHHDMLAAEALGMAMIDAGHFETERPGMVALVDRIVQALPGHEIDVAYVE